MSSLQASTGNLLLRAVTQADFALLEPHLEHQQLKLRDPIYKPNEPIEYVYFLENGVASIVSEPEEGDPVEVGLYGREGMSGSAVVMGAEQSPHASMVQVGAPRHCAFAPTVSLQLATQARSCADYCCATRSR